MRKSTTLYIILLAIAGMYSCKKIITVNLNDAPPQIVIEGNVTNEAGRYTVKISKTVGYTSDNVFPAISGAVVKITDSTMGLTDVLTESSPGTYKTITLQGIQGHTYKLSVVAEGKQYLATSTMPTQINLDSVTFQANIAFGNTIINALPNFQDPLGVSNYYQFVQTINNKQSKQVFVFDDRLSDGKYIARQLFNDSAYIQPKDTVQLEMRCIDKQVFEYLKELSGLDPTNGQPTNPANPTSNIIGGALGYFSANTVQRKKVIIK